MTDIWVSLAVLFFGVVIFFWCRFLKRHYLNFNVLMKIACWVNWGYWIFVDLFIWQNQVFLFPYSHFVGRIQANGACMIIAFILCFMIAFQAPFTVYMNKRR